MHRDVEMQGDGSECVAYGEDSGAQGGGKGERVKGKSVCGYLSMSLKGGRVEISLHFERGLREIFCHIAERASSSACAAASGGRRGSFGDTNTAAPMTGGV